jgi:hypothetical protein
VGKSIKRRTGRVHAQEEGAAAKGRVKVGDLRLMIMSEWVGLRIIIDVGTIA